MKADATNGNSSDDEDIFLHGGVAKPISMYSMNLAKTSGVISSDDDDDDDDVVVEVVPQKRRRGRATKRGRGAAQAGTARTSAAPAEPRKPRKEKASVFEISSGEEDGDEVVEVTPRDFVDVDHQDVTAAESVARAHALLANQANEEHIAAEAEQLARVESDRAERLREEERQREEAEKKREEAKAKALANAKPIQFKVRSGTNLIKMRIRTSDPLIKMLGPFCKKFGLDASKAVMQIEGEDVGENDTVETHDLEENMIVEVVIRS